MTLQYMLDTNIVSYLMREPDGVVASKIEEVGDTSVCCSIIVASELRYGAAKKAPNKLSRHVGAVLAAIEIWPLTEPVDDVCRKIRSELTLSGRLIGPTDMFIAAHPMSEGITLVTDNEMEFKCVNGLSIENWIR